MWSLTEIDPSAAGTHGLTDPRVIAGAEPSAPADVYGLAATAWTALTGAPVAEPRPSMLSVNPGVPPGLAHAIESGLQADPDVRPSADQLADMIYAAAAPAAVRFPIGLVLDDPGSLTTTTTASSAAAPVPPVVSGDGQATGSAVPPVRPAHRLLGLSPLVLAAAAVGVLAVLAGLLVGGIALSGAVRHRAVADPVPTSPAPTGPAISATPTGSPAPASALATPVSAADWTQVVTGLMSVRAHAFSEADDATLGQVFVQNSPAMRYDAAEMAKLSTAGAHAENLDIAVSAVKVTSRVGGVGHAQRGHAGQGLRHRAGGRRAYPASDPGPQDRTDRAARSGRRVVADLSVVSRHAAVRRRLSAWRGRHRAVAGSSAWRT